MNEKINIATKALSANDQIAAQNKDFFKSKHVLVLNMISSPGSGKTSLLEAMAYQYGSSLAVITGDIQMTYDADRIRKAGSAAVQIETHGTCHLTASMVQQKIQELTWDKTRILVIENVGNLVCPSGYQLGEDLKIGLLSVTEGSEKPMKYPSLFTRAQALVITKIDLLPYVDFNLDQVQSDCHKLNTHLQLFQISTKTHQGLEAWFDFLNSHFLLGI